MLLEVMLKTADFLLKYIYLLLTDDRGLANI